MGRGGKSPTLAAVYAPQRLEQIVMYLRGRERELVPAKTIQADLGVAMRTWSNYTRRFPDAPPAVAVIGSERLYDRREWRIWRESHPGMVKRKEGASD
jgi:hypothetical protein